MKNPAFLESSINNAVNRNAAVLGTALVALASPGLSADAMAAGDHPQVAPPVPG